MWPLPKKHFQWEEPEAFRAEMAAATAVRARWWKQPLQALAFAALMMCAWAMAGLDPDSNRVGATLAIAGAILLGVLVAYALPWVSRRVAPGVMVFHNRICRTNGVQVDNFMVRKTASFMILSGDGFRVLSLERHDGKSDHIGMPMDVDVEALGHFLERAGVRRKSAEQPLRWAAGAFGTAGPASRAASSR